MFRAYSDWRELISDHSSIILDGVSWNRDLYRRVIGASGQTAAREIVTAGYVTDPDYASKLIGIMDSYHLYSFDEGMEEDEMSTEDKRKLADLEKGTLELQSMISGLERSKDTLKSGLQEHNQSIIKVTERLDIFEGESPMRVPPWAVGRSNR